jgi:hypothetical protein
MERKQLTMIVLGMIGVFGVQIGFYELVKGNAPIAMVFALLTIGFVCAFKGFGEYRRMEDEQGE